MCKVNIILNFLAIINYDWLFNYYCVQFVEYLESVYFSQF